MTSENETNKNKIILAIVIIMIILISQIAILLANGIFNPKGKNFISLLTNKQLFMEMIKSNLDDFSGDGESNCTMTIRNTSLKKLQSFLNLEKYALTNGNVEININTIKEKEKLDKNIKLTNINSKVQNLEIIKEEDKVAIGMPEVYKDYILLSNKSAEKDLRNLLNISGEQDENTLKEIENIKKKYLKIIESGIRNYIDKIDNVSISINGDNYDTTMYELKLNEDEAIKIYKKILGELKKEDKTISFIVDKINNLKELKKDFINEDSNSEKIKKEDVKNKLEELYNGINEVNSKNEFLNIKLYECDGKNIKTEIELNKGTKYVFLLETKKKDKTDYANLSIEKGNEKFQIKYNGEKGNDVYNGTFTIESDRSISLSKININKLKTSSRNLRTIESLKTIDLSTANDKQIEELRKEIKSNLKPTEGIPDFAIFTPKNNEDIIENSRLAYIRINPIMTKDEVLKILGNLNKSVSGDNEEVYIYWNQADGIELISVKAKGVKLYEVYNDVVLSGKYDKELSEEFGANIENINELVSNIKIGSSREEVISILTENSIEVSKSNLGNKAYKWYDKAGNSVIIEFDENDKVVRIA